MAERRLSVIIPTFNRRSLLDLCLRALLRTSADPAEWELIVVDDGSTDGTSEHVREHFGAGNVRCLRRTQNVGEPNNPGLARNCGIRAAAGQWAAFCDDDGIHLEDVVAATLGALGEPGLYYCAGVWIEKRDEHWGAVVKYDGRVLPGPMPKHYWWAAPVADLVAVGAFDERFRVHGAEDGDLWTRLLRYGLSWRLITGQMAAGVYARREIADMGEFKILNDAQHALRKSDLSIVRNQGVRWGEL